jgi:hypothetical protein
MPPVEARPLLMAVQPASAHERVVRVVVPYGLHRLVYSVEWRALARLVSVGALRVDPKPCRWVLLLVKGSAMPGLVGVPFDPSAPYTDYRGTGYTVLYRTAGAYFNQMEAEEELKRLPARRGKKTAVVDSDDEREDAKPRPKPPRRPRAKKKQAVEEPKQEEVPAVVEVEEVSSDDTEYDSEGYPKPKKPKPKATRPRARKRVQKPEHAEYRAGVRAEQAAEVVPTFAADHLGCEFCTVLAQLLGELKRAGALGPDSSVFFHPRRGWLEALAAQARAAGNPRIAVAAEAEFRRAAARE